MVEGRDIGTVVLPDAPVKVFITARDDVRAARRQRDEVAAARRVSVDDVREALDQPGPGRLARSVAPPDPRTPPPTPSSSTPATSPPPT